MGRRPSCCSKEEGINKGAWTAIEDKILIDYVEAHGHGRWKSLPKKAGLKRCGKSCRLRWLNYLRPGIKRGNISPDEEELIIRLHKLLGNRWSLIAGRLPGRTDNEIKNYWNTNLRKRINNNGSSQQHNAGDEDDDDQLVSTKKKCSKSNVIRTKAVKCSSNLVININDSHDPAFRKYPNNYSIAGDHDQNQDQHENPYNNYQKPTMDQKEDNNAHDDDPMMDFDMISDFLNNSEFDQFINNDQNYEFSGNIDFSPPMRDILQPPSSVPLSLSISEETVLHDYWTT